MWETYRCWFQIISFDRTSVFLMVIRWFADLYLKWVVYDLFTLYLRADWAIVWVHFQLHDFTTQQQAEMHIIIVKADDAVVLFPNRWFAYGCVWK